MIKKIIFIAIILLISSSSIFLNFAQDTSSQSQPDSRARQYDYEFDRLSEEERRRLHMNQDSNERDESMQRARLPIRDDSGVDPATYRERQQPQAQVQNNNRQETSREQVRRETENYMRRNYPEMSERELDETIEKILNQLIDQLEARIEERVRISLKKELIKYLENLLKKYKVDMTTAENMTRERAREQIEQIQRTQTQRQNGTQIPHDNSSYRPPQNNQTQTQQRTQSTPRVQSSQTRTGNGRTVVVRNPQRTTTQTRTQRTNSIKPYFVIYRFIIGSDKDGVIISKANPTLVTITVHTNVDTGRYLYVTFVAISTEDNKEYRVHQSRKFLLLDKRSQYQFYWASEMVGTDKLLPNGRYRVKAVASVHDSKGKVIAKPSRLWGGTDSNISVIAKN